MNGTCPGRPAAGSDACANCGHATAYLRVLCTCCFERLSADDRDDLGVMWNSGAEWAAYAARAAELGSALGPCPRCPVCGRDARLDEDGRVQYHDRNPPLRAVCPGSKMTPLAAGEDPLLEEATP